MSEVGAERARARALAALLAWYAEMGVDEAIGEVGVDWVARGPDLGPGTAFEWPGSAEQRGKVPAASRGGAAAGGPPPSARGLPDRSATATISAPAAAGPAPSAAMVAPSAGGVFRAAPRPVATATPALADARAAALAAPSLAALRVALEHFEGCSLKAKAKTLCFYRGAERARLVVIGEAPGYEEDRSGRPFVGPAGQLLDKMLAAIGLGEADVHITNVVYWRPPSNRTPTPEEAEACRPFLERQLELVGPEVVMLLGGAALKQMTGTLDGIMKARGTWRSLTIAGREVATMATLHPAYLLRSPVAKRVVWRDLLAVEARLGRMATDRERG